MSEDGHEPPKQCAICGTSLLDKPRIADMCLECEFAVGQQTSARKSDGEEWKEGQ